MIFCRADRLKVQVSEQVDKVISFFSISCQIKMIFFVWITSCHGNAKMENSLLLNFISYHTLVYFLARRHNTGAKLKIFLFL